MDSLDGQFLIAMPGMGDKRFERSVVLICAHSGEGAMGFVVNRTLESPSLGEFLLQLSIVQEDEAGTLPGGISDAPLHYGGPVEPGRGFVLHSADYESESTLEVGSRMGLTATLEILRDIAHGRGPRRHIVALGYAGWAAGQLEEEITANGWLTAPADPAIAFLEDNAAKYDETLRSLGIDSALLSMDAGHA